MMFLVLAVNEAAASAEAVDKVGRGADGHHRLTFQLLDHEQEFGLWSKRKGSRSEVLAVDDALGLAGGGYGPRMGDWELTLMGGGVTPHDFHSGAYSVSLGLGHYLTDHVEIGLRQGLAFSDLGSNLRANTRGVVNWHFGAERWRPFVGMSVGGMYGDGGSSWLAGPEVGIKWFIQPQTYVVAMAEYQIFFQRTDDFEGRSRRGDFVLSVGIGFLF